MKSRMDGPSLAEGLKRLQASYPTVPPLDSMNVAAYAEGLAEYEGRDFIEATKRVVKVCKFFPSIAEIIEHIEPIQEARWEKKRQIDRAEENKRITAGAEENQRSFAENMEKIRAELEKRGVLPTMPKPTDGPMRRIELQKQAEKLLEETKQTEAQREERMAELRRQAEAIQS